MIDRFKARKYGIGEGRSPMRRALVVLIVLAAIVAVVWLAVALVHRAHSGSGPGGAGRGGRGGFGGRPQTTVGVATATLSDVPITLDGLGTVTPAATVTVTPQVSGVLTQILFREGQVVRKGQPLAIIDPRPFRAQLEQAQGNLARDQAQLANARLLLSRDETLLAQDSIARQDVDTQRALVRQLQGTVAADQGSVNTARLNLGFSTIVAPVAGRVGLRQVDLGNFVGTGTSGGIVVITEVTPIDVEFTLPQDTVPQVQEQSAHGRLPVVALDRTKTIVLDNGYFSTLDNQVDTTTGTVRAKARFANTAGKLFPNQFVNIRLTLQVLHNVVSVPVTAVRTGPQGDFVWILNPDRTVTRRAVTRGPATATTTSITQGLQAGERVITEGGDRLTDGAHVMLPGDKPQAWGGGRGGRGRRGQGGGQAQAGGGQGGGGQWNGSSAVAGAGGGQAPGAFNQQRQAEAQGGQTGSGFGGGGPAGGGFAPSPQMQAARQAMRQACAGDMQKLCPGLEGRDAFMCMRQKGDQASAGCKAAMEKMRAARGGGGGGRGGDGAGG